MSISQITSDFEEPTVGETSTNLLRDERIILNVGGIKEFSYFQIPFTSKHDLAEKAAGELLDDFAYAIEELLCLAISKLVDRISITFYRDGSKVELLLDLGLLTVLDIKKYLENNFSNMIIKLDFGNNYKSLTLSMSRLFTRNTIKKHSKIGMLTRSE
ncbi:7837_t:CDS:2 [Entrophospora sp. SA101]|nr:7837_t:CDS:2 [Entrophospora sp. SA101]